LGGFHLFDNLVPVYEDGTLFPVASLDFTFENRENNNNAKTNITSKDPELGKVFRALFGTRMHFTFFTEPNAFIHPKTGY
jgi:hypothetical protein